MISSHIQMPKVVIRQFAGKDNCVYYYDFSCDKVKRGYAKTIYTKNDYYSESVEKILSAEVETRLGELIKRLKETSFNDDAPELKPYIDTAFNYLYSLISRSPSFHERGDVDFQDLSLTDQERHDYIASHGMRLLSEHDPLNNYHVGIIDNSSEQEFVLPGNGIVQFDQRKLFCPLTPRRGIVFEHIVKKDDYEIVNVWEADGNLVHNMNIKAINQEIMREKRYVISRDKSLLETLIQELNNKGTSK